MSTENIKKVISLFMVIELKKCEYFIKHDEIARNSVSFKTVFAEGTAHFMQSGRFTEFLLNYFFIIKLITANCQLPLIFSIFY